MYYYYRVAPDQIQNYVCCGRDFDSHLNYFRLVFPGHDLLPTINMCACGRKIIRNGYIKPKDSCDIEEDLLDWELCASCN